VPTEIATDSCGSGKDTFRSDCRSALPCPRDANGEGEFLCRKGIGSVWLRR
jgi:hypothetical protein